jgi:hypothetical protein
MAEEESSDMVAYRIFKITMISSVCFIGASGFVILNLV